MLWKCCTQYTSTFGTFSSGQRTENGQFSFQFQRKGMPKNVKTTAQFHSSHVLAKQCSKFSKTGFNSTWTKNFQMFKLDSEKAEESKIKLPKSVRSSKKQASTSVRSSKKQASTSALLTTKAFDCVDHNKLENSERDGNTRPPDLTLEKSVCRSRKTELDMKQQTGSK